MKYEDKYWKILFFIIDLYKIIIKFNLVNLFYYFMINVMIFNFKLIFLI